MKKTVSLLLAIVLFASACILNAGAVTNSKLSATLTEALSNMSDTDKIHVWIMLGKLNTKSDSELERMAYEACGFVYGDNLTVTQKTEVRNKKIQLKNEDRHQAVKELLSRMGVEYSDVVGGWNDDDVLEGWKPEFYLTKAKILAVTDIEEIDTIDLCYDDYYVIGTMNDWKIDQAYRLHNRGEGILELNQIALSENDVFKTIKSNDGSTYSESDCYPIEGNYNDDGTLIKFDSSYYYLEFCPAGDKEGLNWHDGTIYIENLEPPEDSTEAPKEGELYRERLKECYNLDEYDASIGFYTTHLMYCKELYYHRNENNDIDWALINCYCNVSSPIEYTNVVGNRVLHPGTQYYPFDTCYGIYDVKNDKFVDATNKAAYQYDNFVRAFDEIVDSGKGLSMADIDNRGKGRPLGDIDNDDEMTVVDVTLIQRCEAQMMEYPSSDEFCITYDFNTIHYYSDFNRDGERDILDATCIQRYLVGIAYPKG